MALVVIDPGRDTHRWEEVLKPLDPELDIRHEPDTGDPAEILYALTWNHPPGALTGYPNLRFICSMGAGIDHFLKDDRMPEGVPCVRLVDRLLTSAMTEYVLTHVLRYHRQVEEFRAAQAAREWAHLPTPDTELTQVGIMGLGMLGGDAARQLADFGFRVAGWSRTPKHIEGVACYHGRDQLGEFLKETRYLVCLLPLTPETEDIIDREVLKALPQGACVINSARGRHLVDEDLIEALDSGHIAGATLDVFRTEPLPADHPFWTHPRVFVTPHAASHTVARSVAPQIIENIRRVRAGEPLINQVDLKRGY
ncbi:MAG: glyoxylate/hydroxypyruvate reductase A [Acetobacterales bacterium]